jgi:poly(3-hydroxybutyrate) depolymerase
MSSKRSSRKLLLVAIFGVCGYGCSTSTGGGAGSGGSTSMPPGSGGTSVAGGSSGSGGVIPGTGGAGTGGASTSSGGKASGGQPGTGGVTTGTGGRGTGGASSSTGGNGSGGESNTGGATTGTGGKGTGGASSSMGGNTAMGGSAAGGTMAGSGGRATGGTTGGGGSRTGGASGGAGGANTGGQATGGSTGTSTEAGKSAGCGKAPTLTSSQYNNGNPISITVNGSQRRYILSVPTNYVNTTAYKFILTLHARDSNDKSEYNEKYYDLQPLSNNTVIFAAPNGVNGSTPCTGTGVGESNCGWPAGNNNMELMDAVVKQVMDNFCVDVNHIYATGWSYGGSMSYEIACARPLEQAATNGWGVRAAAVYAAAQMSGSCKPSATNPVAYYASHGTSGGDNGDGVLPYSGGVTLAQNWSNANGCTWQTPTMVKSGNHVCTKMAGCKAGYPVEFCSFNGGHPAYPDGGQPQSSWGPQEAWTFLSQF